MTAKEKAEELVLKFREVPIEDSLLWYVGFEISKQFALIAVDEIIKSNPRLPHTLDWQQVKNEIENL